MVKLGSHLSDKPKKPAAADDGFDNVPLIAPLEVSQLQQTFANRVTVRTATRFEQQQKKRSELHLLDVKRLSINVHAEVSEKAKITGLIFITLAFLSSLLLLLTYKAMWYDHLTCPEGFILKDKHCAPAGLEGYYTQQQPGPGAALHAVLGRRRGTRLPSPWLPLSGTLREAEEAEQGGGGTGGDQ